MKSVKQQLNFENHNFFIGIDKHKKNWKVTILGERTSIKTFSQDPSPKILYEYLCKNFPGGIFHCAYEAGFSGFWASDELNKLGINTIVVNPADIPTTDKERQQKEDKRDSRKIARCLRAGELEAIRVPSFKNRCDRTLLRTRKVIVKDTQRIKNRIKGYLNFHGYTYPPQFTKVTTHWSKNFVYWLENLPTQSRSAKISLNLLVTQLKQLRIKLLEVNREIRKLSQEFPYKDSVSYLLSIPGVGLIIAMTFLTEIENIKSYKTNDHLCSYIGLVPSTHSSGDRQANGKLTKRGKHYLRSLIVEAAWTTLRNDPTLLLKYNELCSRMKPNQAIIRIAKKLIIRMRYVLINQVNYKIMQP